MNFKFSTISGHKFRHGMVADKILARDKKCVFCGKEDNLVVDHIIPVKKGGKSTLENQRILCFSCHSRLTNLKPTGILSKVGKYMREWRKLHPDYLTNYAREWRKKHKGYNKYSSEKYYLYKNS